MTELRPFVRSIALTVALLGISLATALGQSTEELKAGFIDPPPSARPMTWWHWMGGNISREGITADLESMKRVGLQGAMIFHVGELPFNGDVEFMSPQWWDLMRFAADEAARLGLKLGAHNCPGWSASGGPWVAVEQSMQKVVWSTTTVEGDGHRVVALPKPEIDRRWNYFRDIAVIAMPDAGSPVDQSKLIDLTSHVSGDDQLTWDAPPGRWRVYRFGHTTTGKENHPAAAGARGLEVDKFNPAAVEAHFKSYPEKIITNNSPAGRKAFSILAIDSYEAGDQNWSPVFRDEFKHRRGYDPVPWLPILSGAVVGGDDLTQRFKHDMERTVAELFHDNYYGQMGKLVHQHPGLEYFVEPYGGAYNTITAGGKADMVAGEFWQAGQPFDPRVASSAHVHGKTVVAAEAFTADPVNGRWQEDPYALKPTGDAAFAAGVNLMVLHTYTHQPLSNVVPGFTMGWWGTHFGRTNTWWEQSRPFFDYLSRCQFMLQQGVPAVDVLTLGSAAAPLGYRSDECDEDVLLRDIKVQDGNLLLPNGTRYALLVLPADSTRMTRDLAKRIRELVRDGATVIGPKPTSTDSLSDYPAADAEVKQIGEEVWGDCDGSRVKSHAYGKGRVVCGTEVSAVLAEHKLGPDVSFPANTWPLAWTHRRTRDAEIYFLSNQRRAPVSAEVSFRASGRAPQLWDPENGNVQMAPVWSAQGDRTNVFLRLNPGGSVFVVFPKQSAVNDHVVDLVYDGKSISAPDRLGDGVVIHDAQYGILDDPTRCVDVTEALRQRLATGLMLSGSNELAGRDPAPMVVKSLRLVYDLRGKRITQTLKENEQFDFESSRVVPPPPAELRAMPDGKSDLLAYKSGMFEIRFASGHTQQVNVDRIPDAVAINGPWQVRFPPGRGAPSGIELDQLASWTANANAGVRYFSGTAEYTATFNHSADVANANRVAILDLGDVQNIAEVELNGQNLGILWKPPFRIDVSGKLRAGTNELKIRVTNLWANRLIGDEQEPDDVQWGAQWAWNGSKSAGGNPLANLPDWVHNPATRPSTRRVTLTTWKFYEKDSPLIDSGLLGPVRIVNAVRQELR